MQPATVAAPAPAPAAAAHASRGKPRVLDPAECRAVLREVGWGVLATVTGAQPYAVPVGYALGSDCVYIASGPGRKRTNLESHPAACLTVCDVESYDSWHSVVIQGEVEEVTAVRARALAVAAFAAQRSPRGAASGPNVKRLLTARIFRLPLSGVAGRARDSRG